MIVTYQSSDLVTECLTTLGAAAPSRDVHVVVVDNDSSDDTVAVAQAHPLGPTVVETGVNGGYSAGINVGMATLAPVGADAHLILNPDCRFGPGALDEMADELERSGAGIVAPRILDDDGRLSHSIFREPTVLRGVGCALLGDHRAGRIPALGEQEMRDEPYADSHDIDAASGAVLLVSAACADAVGEWDEGYFLYSEETDFQFRAARAGYRVRYHADAVATHDGGESQVSPRLWALLTVNRVRMFSKFNGPVATTLYRGAVLLNEALRALRGRTPSRAAVAALLSPSRRRALYPPVALEHHRKNH